MMQEKSYRLLRRVFLIGSVLAAIKMIFFDYTMDEEYQIMMAYRNLQGDRLFGEMWEPHQTSAFLCIGLMWIYHLVTGSYTGVLLFLRIVTTGIQIMVSYSLYKHLREFISEKTAFLCGLTFFNVVPKAIQIPEFASMQVWFFTLLVLKLMEYYGTDNIVAGGEYAKSYEKRKGKKSCLVMAGIFMALEVLSYPSCLLLFPFFLLVLFLSSGKEKWKDCLIFGGTCAVCAFLWLLWIWRRVPIKEFIRNVSYLISFDLTHDLSGATKDKADGFWQNIADYSLLLLLIFSLSFVIYLLLQRKNGLGKGRVTLYFVYSVMVSCGVQFFCWTFLQSGYEKPQIHLLVIWIAVIFTFKKVDERRKILWVGLAGTFLSLIAVSYLSDLAIYYSLPHGLPGTVFGIIILVLALEKEEGTKESGAAALLLSVICLLSIWGKGFVLREGRDYDTVLQTRGIMKSGPAVGVLTDYMNAYIYNCNLEDFEKYLSKDDKILIVNNMVFSEGTTPYMAGEYEVCHYSIVDPTAYDERLLTYWELYPEKQPNVIVVDCWYGGLLEDQDSFIMNYIENEFGYTECVDGRYVRFYKKLP